MRAAVYNRYWHTGGGGEAYGTGLAAVLRQRSDVDLLCHRPVDTAWLSERLRVDLTGIGTRVVADRPGAVTKAASDYDLFVNVSFMSGDLAPHRRSIYVVHFPSPIALGLSKPKRAIVRGLRAIGGMAAAVEYRSGFFERERGAARGARWTTGEGVLRLKMPEGVVTPVTFVFGAGRPTPARVTIEVGGKVVSALDVGGPVTRAQALRGTSATVLLSGEGRGNECNVTIRSDTFVPAADGFGVDSRCLGVPVRGVRVGSTVAAHVETWLPWLATSSTPDAWHRSYGALVANSEFTAAWIGRWWSTESQVLHPPVTMQRRGDKVPMILNVGRFFGVEQGHSKKQLELVQAFRALVDSGQRDWTLHLVGGCEASGRSYLERVRSAAEGYPVAFHIDATGAELAELYAKASIYWHASGMGENPDRHPGRLEHFGMTTVEAMSAGAVPVVIGLAGQVETVRDGIDGYHFLRSDELVAHTRRLISDERRRASMADSAEARAREFSLGAFGERLWAIVDGLPSPDGAEHYGPAEP